jgi:hypothetical protein
MEPPIYFKTFRKLAEADGAETISQAKTRLTACFHKQFFHEDFSDFQTYGTDDFSAYGRAMLRRLEAQGFAHWNVYAQLWTISKNSYPEAS